MQLYAGGTRVIEKNGFLVRLEVALFGHAKVCSQGELEYHAFRCPAHGLAVDYLRGYDRYLDCPRCRSG